MDDRINNPENINSKGKETIHVTPETKEDKNSDIKSSLNKEPVSEDNLENKNNNHETNKTIQII